MMSQIAAGLMNCVQPARGWRGIDSDRRFGVELDRSCTGVFNLLFTVAFTAATFSVSQTIERDGLMNLIVVILVVLLILALLGGGYGFRSGNNVLAGGGGLVGLILLILVIMFLMGRL